MSYPISDYAKGLFTAAVNYPQTVDITINGLQETFAITEKDIEQNGLTITRRSISGNRLQIGSANASTLTLRLKNIDGKFNGKVFEGAEMFVNLGIYKTDAKQWEQATKQFIPLGYFIVDSRPAKLNTITLTAYDRMAKFDKEYDSTFNFPVTLKELLLDACSKCGVTISPSVDIDSLPNITTTISALPENGLDTYRTALIWICELTASVAYIDWEGKLRLGWYAETALPDKLTKSNRYTSFVEENDITISGVKIKTDDDTEYVSGTDDYQMEIVGNGFAQSNIQDLVNNIGLAINGTTYRPFSATCTPNCWVYPLDRMVFVDNAGVETQGLVTYHKFVLNGRTDIKSEGETAQTAGYASAGNLTRYEKQVLNSVAKKAQNNLTTAEQALIDFNKTIANSMGLYTTTITLEDGSKKFYQHDQPTLAESNYIATETAGGFAYTNSGWNGGEPVWQYGLDADGNAIYKSITVDFVNALGITAKEITIKDSANNVIFEAKGEGINANVILGGWQVDEHGFHLKPYNGEPAIKIWDDTNCIVYRDNEWAQGVVAYFKQDAAAAHSRTYKITVKKKYSIRHGNGASILFTKTPIDVDTPIYEGFWAQAPGIIPIDSDNEYGYLTYVGGDINEDSIEPENDNKIPAGIWKSGSGYIGYKGIGWAFYRELFKPYTMSLAGLYGEDSIILHAGEEPSKTDVEENEGFYITETGFVNAPYIKSKTLFNNYFSKQAEIHEGKVKITSDVNTSAMAQTEIDGGEITMTNLNKRITVKITDDGVKLEGDTEVLSSNGAGSPVLARPLYIGLDGVIYKGDVVNLYRD